MAWIKDLLWQFYLGGRIYRFSELNYHSTAFYSQSHLTLDGLPTGGGQNIGTWGFPNSTTGDGPFCNLLETWTVSSTIKDYGNYRTMGSLTEI